MKLLDQFCKSFDLARCISFCPLGQLFVAYSAVTVYVDLTDDRINQTFGKSFCLAERFDLLP